MNTYNMKNKDNRNDTHLKIHTYGDEAVLATTSDVKPNALKLSTPTPSPVNTSAQNSPAESTSSGSGCMKSTSRGSLKRASRRRPASVSGPQTTADRATPSRRGRCSSVNLTKPSFAHKSSAHLQLPATPFFRARTSSGSNFDHAITTGSDASSGSGSGSGSSGKKAKKSLKTRLVSMVKKLGRSKKGSKSKSGNAACASIPVSPANAVSTTGTTTSQTHSEEKKEEPQLINSAPSAAKSAKSSDVSSKKADRATRPQWIENAPSVPVATKDEEKKQALPRRVRPVERRPKVITVGGRRYAFRGLLGSGTYGQVFSAHDIDSGKKVAVKLFKVDNDDARKEIDIYRRASAQCKYLPKFIHATNLEGKLTMITERQGHNLQHLSTRIPKQRFYSQTVAMLGMELCNMFEELHNAGYVHRDIHMGNVLAGHQDESKLYLCDLGFAQKYRNEDGSHYKKEELQIAVGTSRFSSRNNHKHTKYSRRDDMESLAYLLIHCYAGSLPWNEKARIKDRRKKWDAILKEKLEFEESDFFHNLPAELQQFTSAVRDLDFEQRPDYHAYRAMFKRLRDREEKKHGKRFFDWMYVWDNHKQK